MSQYYYKGIPWGVSMEHVKKIFAQYLLSKEDKEILIYNGNIEDIEAEVSFVFNKQSELQTIVCDVADINDFDTVIFRLKNKYGKLSFYREDKFGRQNDCLKDNIEIGIWEDGVSVVGYELAKNFDSLIIRYWNKAYYKKRFLKNI